MSHINCHLVLKYQHIDSSYKSAGIWCASKHQERQDERQQPEQRWLLVLKQSISKSWNSGYILPYAVPALLEEKPPFTARLFVLRSSRINHSVRVVILLLRPNHCVAHQSRRANQIRSDELKNCLRCVSVEGSDAEFDMHQGHKHTFLHEFGLFLGFLMTHSDVSHSILRHRQDFHNKILKIQSSHKLVPLRCSCYKNFLKLTPP